MAEGFALKVDVRERTGKGAARALRREGKIPAVIYGANEPPVPIAVPLKEVTLALYGGGFLTNVWQLDVDGKTVQALARDYQREPVKDKLVHVDFLRVSAKSRVTVEVPLVLVGEEESPGLTAGGVAALVEFTLAVDAPATRIPGNIEVSIAGHEIGATVTTADITLPDGVEIAGQLDEPKPLATISQPVAEESDESAEGGDAGGEDEASAAEGDAAADSSEN